MILIISADNDIITDDKYKKVETGDITVESFFKSTAKTKGIFNKQNTLLIKTERLTVVLRNLGFKA